MLSPEFLKWHYLTTSAIALAFADTFGFEFFFDRPCSAASWVDVNPTSDAAIGQFLLNTFSQES